MSRTPQAAPSGRIYAIFLCFFVSGAAGLIYQVAWTKALGLIFGHTVYAIAIVLAAFMGGLAAGSAIIGRWGERQSRPIAVYGWIEILIGMTGALSLLALGAVRALYLIAYHSVAHSTPLLMVTRLAGSFLVLFIPTFLMGGTLPIVIRGVTLRSAEFQARLSRLYWINTAGAVAGALAAGFLLLPEIGLRATILLAAAFNFFAGFLAMAVAEKRTAGDATASAAKPAPAAGRPAIPAFLLIGFALVGATAMAYEIAWSRLLSVTLSSSTYAFTLMLVTFLAGIAIGSAIFERWSAGREVSVGAFGITQTFTALAAMFFLVLFEKLPVVMWALINATHKTFGGLVLAQFATGALAMLPAAIVFGFNFPLVTLLIAKSAQSEGSPESASEASAAGAVGRAYAANTVGAIAGALLTGFFLVPRLGSFRVVAAAAVANLLLAVYLAARRVPRRGLELAGTLALALLVAWAGWSGIFYDAGIANFGVITNRSLYPKSLRLDEVVRMTDLVFAEDGLNASVGVVRGENLLALRINGKTDASNGDQLTQLLIGHLGMVMQATPPKKVLIIGFGSGMTAYAVSRYPEVEEIDCIEIEPAVIRAAPYLETLNHGVLHDPRLHIIEDDARNYLFTTQKKYDLIVSEPSNPWIAGVATLFTNEFYGQVRGHLNPGGLLVQWLQSYTLFPADLRMAMGTLAHQFPGVTAWQGMPGDTIFMAQSEPGTLSLDRLHQLWTVPALRTEYENLGMRSPESLLAFHLLDDADLRRFSASAPLNTDDLTQLEYHAPLAIFSASSGPANIKILESQRSQVLSASISVANTQAAVLDAAWTLSVLHDRQRESVLLAALSQSQNPPSAGLQLLKADWLAATGKLPEAQQTFEDARRMDPASMDGLLGLAEVQRLEGHYDAALPLLAEALKRDDKSVAALTSYALLEKSLGNWLEAADFQKRRLAADPTHPTDAMAALAELQLRTGDVRGAATTCVDILNRDPYNLQAHRFLADLLMRNGQWEQARVQLEVVARYYPMADRSVYPALAEVYRNLKRPVDAEDASRKGQRLFADDPSQFKEVSAQ